MQLRLYRNDGKGNFDIDPAAFPNTGMNISVAITDDFNGDGYPDLFIGGRSTPQNYGLPPESYLFVNDGHGHFTDIAPAKNPDIAHIGMVTGAVLADLDGDKEKELVLTGEWMSPRIFSVKKDRLEEIKTNLSNMYGWWRTVAVLPALPSLRGARCFRGLGRSLGVGGRCLRRATIGRSRFSASFHRGALRFGPWTGRRGLSPVHSTALPHNRRLRHGPTSSLLSELSLREVRLQSVRQEFRRLLLTALG